MRKLLWLVLAGGLSLPTAYADGPWKIEFQDIKLPSQAVLEHYSWATPILGTTTTVLNKGTAATSAATTIQSFTAQPDVARNVTISPGGQLSNIVAGSAVVQGTNIYGQTITEYFAVGNAQSAMLTGNKAFKTVTSVYFPPTSGSGVQVNIGLGTKLGVHRCMNNAGKYVFSNFDSAYETTRGSVAVDATHAESNTFTPNGTLNGVKPVEVYFVENYRCHP